MHLRSVLLLPPSFSVVGFPVYPAFGRRRVACIIRLSVRSLFYPSCWRPAEFVFLVSNATRRSGTVRGLRTNRAGRHRSNFRSRRHSTDRVSVQRDTARRNDAVSWMRTPTRELFSRQAQMLQLPQRLTLRPANGGSARRWRLRHAAERRRSGPLID